MTNHFSLILALLAIAPLAALAEPAPDVPKGEVTHYTFESSRIFPGTFRDYWIYVPRQYDPAQPACLFVDQDGIQFNAPRVFDELIASHEMPVTIGVFIMHGRVKALSPSALDRFNRSYEYDGLGPNYVNFLLNELLPDVEKKTTADGRPIRISSSANDRCIGGSSSGAICAFTAAWERPDAFSRVFSSIGTFVGLRGGNNYPTLIRKTEPKAIRVFLQDGSSDLNIYGGDWWMANQEMERALRFAGYQVNHIWGTGGHNGQQATEIFPDAMRWLWKGWPTPVQAGLGSGPLQEILIPGDGWQLVGDGFHSAAGPAANATGALFFSDTPTGALYQVGADGKANVFLSNSSNAVGQAFGPDGRLYAANDKGVEVIDDAGHARSIIGRFHAHNLVVTHTGAIYVTDAGDATHPSHVWLINAQGKKTLVDTGLKSATGVTLSPDQSLLYVADGASRWVYSYQIQPDGSLAYKQQYYHLHVPDTADDSGAEGMCVDREGRLYVATRMGVQVCDQAGRVNCIIPLPGGRVTGLAFGGPASDTLFATCGSQVFQRKLKVIGAHAFAAPDKPAPPNL